MTSTNNSIVALALKHGASSYRNRADTQNPAYGFTETALAAFAQELLAGQCLHQIAEPAAASQAAQAAVPDGWQLVPVKPAAQMKRAAQKADMDHSPHAEWLKYHWDDIERVWGAMLAAAPAHPAEGVQA